MEEVVEPEVLEEMLVLLQLVELEELVFQLQLQDRQFLILVVVGHMVQVQVEQLVLVELAELEQDQVDHLIMEQQIEVVLVVEEEVLRQETVVQV